LTRSDREFEIEEWLAETGVDAPWELAPSLVDMGFEVERLQTMRDDFHEALPVVLNHLCATYQVYSLLREIGQGAGRISEIVKALKSYAYLDQAPVQPVNIHEGLNDTLVILRHKLKQGVNVRREYADDLPIIQAYGSELNQVWTNLIDNSIDALDGNGEIIIRTRQEEQWIVVEIEDNGPGIPQEIQSRIFDAFFTTKPPGKGTGLGLNISYNIVVYKHQGDLKVVSQPGKTCFEVWLPLKVA
jgi:signal transduction histidine kinase